MYGQLLAIEVLAVCLDAGRARRERLVSGWLGVSRCLEPCRQVNIRTREAGALPVAVSAS